ncbi:hypothetical protein V9K67_02135 [Paraflavisolibacter sp. H34]|uniref:hypothetical protein n=1 Tax=Huijunlia imazamoxiresistens TaxID=3127457 RepID=UPI00301A53D2
MWQAVRGLEEVVMLLQETARQFERAGNVPKSQEFQHKAQDTQKKSVALREQIFLLEPASQKLSSNGDSSK